MFMDYITYQGVAQVVAEQMMLQDLERHFCKSHSSLKKMVSQHLVEYQQSLKKQYPSG